MHNPLLIATQGFISAAHRTLPMATQGFLDIAGADGDGLGVVPFVKGIVAKVVEDGVKGFMGGFE